MPATRTAAPAGPATTTPAATHRSCRSPAGCHAGVAPARPASVARSRTPGPPPGRLRAIRARGEAMTTPITATSVATATAATPTPAAGALKGNKDEFLKLFMAQLEHQD